MIAQIWLLISLLIFLLNFSSCESGDYPDELEIGKLFISSDQNALAIEKFSEAINKKPNEMEAYKYRCMAYYNQGNLDSAMMDIDHFTKLSNQDDKEVFLIKGLIQEKQNDTIGALESFSKVILMDSNYIDGWFWRGLLATRFRDFNTAYSDFKKVLDLDPKNEIVPLYIDNLENRKFEFFQELRNKKNNSVIKDSSK